MEDKDIKQLENECANITEEEFINVVKQAFRSLKFNFVKQKVEKGEFLFDSQHMMNFLAKYTAIEATTIDIIETEMYKDKIKDTMERE